MKNQNGDFRMFGILCAFFWMLASSGCGFIVDTEAPQAGTTVVGNGGSIQGSVVLESTEDVALRRLAQGLGSGDSSGVRVEVRLRLADSVVQSVFLDLQWSIPKEYRFENLEAGVYRVDIALAQRVFVVQGEVPLEDGQQVDLGVRSVRLEIPAGLSTCSAENLSHCPPIVNQGGVVEGAFRIMMEPEMLRLEREYFVVLSRGSIGSHYAVERVLIPPGDSVLSFKFSSLPPGEYYVEARVTRGSDTSFPLINDFTFTTEGVGLVDAINWLEIFADERHEVVYGLHQRGIPCADTVVAWDRFYQIRRIFADGEDTLSLWEGRFRIAADSSGVFAGVDFLNRPLLQNQVGPGGCIPVYPQRTFPRDSVYIPLNFGPDSVAPVQRFPIDPEIHSKVQAELDTLYAGPCYQYATSLEGFNVELIPSGEGVPLSWSSRLDSPTSGLFPSYPIELGCSEAELQAHHDILVSRDGWPVFPYDSSEWKPFYRYLEPLDMSAMPESITWTIAIENQYRYRDTLSITSVIVRLSITSIIVR